MKNKVVEALKFLTIALLLSGCFSDHRHTLTMRGFPPELGEHRIKKIIRYIKMGDDYCVIITKTGGGGRCIPLRLLSDDDIDYIFKIHPEGFPKAERRKNKLTHPHSDRNYHIENGEILNYTL